jgi:hypothetical protein
MQKMDWPSNGKIEICHSEGAGVFMPLNQGTIFAGF